MTVRLLMTATAWAALEPSLAALKPKAGSPPEFSDRLCLAAVLYLARTGLPWRDLPRAFGRGEAVYTRFRRWEARGRWRQLWARRPCDACHVALHRCLARTVVRAHQPAAGARNTTVGTRHRLGDALGVGSPPSGTPAVLTNRPVWHLT